MDNIEKRIKRLTSDIIKYNTAYYIDNAPIISDIEYDIKYKELSQLLEENPKYLTTDSPVNKITTDNTKGFKQRSHLSQMYSLDNTYNTDELDSFLRKASTNEYCVECKIDGLAIDLVYIDGKFSRAITRGDGSIGDDVTNNFLQIKDVPLTIDKTEGTIEIRGEVYITKSQFQKINLKLAKSGNKPYANPRNLASGSLKLHSTTEVKKRGLSFKAYEVISEFFLKQHEKLNWLEENGFDTPDWKVVDTKNVSKVLNSISQKKSTYDFDIDGAVIKVNNTQLQRKLGYNNKYPKWATAFKFDTERVCTTLLDIEFSVGRTGVITPIAILKPVLIGGTVVKRATLHNEAFILDLGLSPGCQVFLEKGGEIIPKIVGLYGLPNKDKQIRYPAVCPSCGSPLQNIQGEVKWFCPNKFSCKAQLVEALALFVSKKAMNIDGFGEEISKLLINLELVQWLPDIYCLEYSDLEGVAGFKKTSINKLLKAIENSKDAPLENFIYSLGIPTVGVVTAKILVKHFKTLYKLSKASLSEIEAIDGLGYVVSNNIYNWFHSDDGKQLISAFRRILKHKKYITPASNDNSLENKKICITGSFDGYHRDDIISLIESKGGTYTSNVTKETDILLSGDGKVGNKLKDAEKYKTQIIHNLNFLTNGSTETTIK